MSWGAKGSGAPGDVGRLVVLAALWAVMVALAGPRGDFPLNDDWVYARSVKAILETGQFRLLDFSLASAFPQAYWGALFCKVFGFSFTALRASTLVLGLAGVLATYGLLRESKVAPEVALVGAAALAANPLYFALSLTFMTDVPFCALAVIALYLLVRGLHRESATSLILGILVSYLALLTRQLGFVLLLGFAVAWLCTRPPTFRGVAIAIVPLAVGVLLHSLLHQWLEAQGRVPVYATSVMLERAFQKFLPRLAGNGFTVLVYAGLFVLPCSLLAFHRSFADERRTRARRRAWGVIAVFAAVLAVIAPRGGMPLSVNVLTWFGIGPLTLRDTYLLGLNYPPASLGTDLGWSVVSVLAALGTALLLERCTDFLVACIREVRSGGLRALGPVPVLLAVSASAFVVLIATMGLDFLDRYVLPCLPFALIAVCTGTKAFAPQPTYALARLSAWLLVAIGAAFSVLATHDYLAWNRARWAATNALEQRGVTSAVIDGGYEYNGWRGYDSRHREHPGKRWWWITDDDYVVASGPIAGYREVASYPFARWLLRVQSRIVVLQR